MNKNIKKVEYDGISYDSRKQFAKENNVSYNRLMYLINKKNMSFDEAATNLLLEKMEEEEQLDSIIKKPTESAIETKLAKDMVSNNIITDKDINKIKPSTWTRPVYIDITSPKQLIDELEKEHNIKVINLIDFENVGRDKKLLKEYINNEGTLNIFFYNALHHSNEFFNIIKGSTNINLQVQTFECANQLVDHLITYYLGAIRANFPDMRFNIISKDTGFYGFISSLCTDKVKGVGINYIEDKELRFKYCLCKYIIDNNLFVSRNCIAYREIENFFSDFNNRDKMTQADVENLFESIIKFDIGEEFMKGTFRWIKFRMENIKEFVERYR